MGKLKGVWSNTIISSYKFATVKHTDEETTQNLQAANIALM